MYPFLCLGHKTSLMYCGKKLSSCGPRSRGIKKWRRSSTCSQSSSQRWYASQRVMHMLHLLSPSKTTQLTKNHTIVQCLIAMSCCTIGHVLAPFPPRKLKVRPHAGTIVVCLFILCSPKLLLDTAVVVFHFIALRNFFCDTAVVVFHFIALRNLL